MSISYDEPLNDEAQKRLKEIFGDPVALDEKMTLLSGKVQELDRSQMSDLAMKAGQPIAVELHSEGEQRVVAGQTYEVKPDGWTKVAGKKETAAIRARKRDICRVERKEATEKATDSSMG